MCFGLNCCQLQSFGFPCKISLIAYMQLRFNQDQNGFQLSVKINLQFLWFCFTTLYDWFKKQSHHLLNQSDAKPEPIIATWSHAFSHTWRLLGVFAMSFHNIGSLFCLHYFVVIGHDLYFGFTTLNNIENNSNSVYHINDNIFY